MPSILPSYEYDIFISYRQNDNRSGWVTEFVNTLQDELAATLKDPVSIYFDSSPNDGLHETHDVDGSLRDKVKCIVFIPIISQTYCDPNSFAWQKEFLPFLEFTRQDQFGLDVKVTSGNVTKRVLPITIHDIDREDQNLFEETVGVMRPVDFIYKEPGVNRPLSPDDSEEKNLNGIKYKNQINKVANAIKEIISAIKYGNESSHSKSSHPQEKQVHNLEKVGSGNARKKRLAGIIIPVALLIFAAIYFTYSYVSGGLDNSELKEYSLVVLPFEDLSSNKDQEFYCDGISAELLHTLGKIPNLKVPGRTSSFAFKNKNTDLREIGNILDVEYILEGSIRKAGDNLLVTAALISSNNGFQLWSNSYNRNQNEVFAVQDEITQAVMRALNIEIKSKEDIPRVATTKNLEAYDKYLRARQLMVGRGENLLRAIELLEEVIEMDNTFAPAYAGIAKCISLLFFSIPDYLEHHTWTEGDDYANKALKLDPNNSEAHMAKGMIAAYYHWDFDLAESHLSKSLKLNPNDPEVLNFLGDYYRIIDHPDALLIEEKALALDPLRIYNYSDIVGLYDFHGDYENVIALGEKVIPMTNLVGYENFIDFVKLGMLNAYFRLNQLDKAREIGNSLIKEPNSELTKLWALSILAFMEGNNDDALRITYLMDEKDLYLPAAWNFLQMGYWKEAAVRYEKAYDNHDPRIILEAIWTIPYQEQPELANFVNKPEIKELLTLVEQNRAKMKQTSVNPNR